MAEISFVEEAVFNEEHMCHIKGWRRYRIEYGFECGCPEGVVYLPRHIDSSVLEDFIQVLIKEPHG